MICAACTKPIKPGDFYISAHRASDTVCGDDELSFAAGFHTVHVPSCPARYTPEEWATLYPAEIYERFGADPPLQPENAKL